MISAGQENKIDTLGEAEKTPQIISIGGMDSTRLLSEMGRLDTIQICGSRP